MLKQLVKTSVFSFGSRIFLTATNLIIMYAVSREMGEAPVGIYSISTFFYYLFALLTSCELTTYFGKEIAHRKNQPTEIKRLFGELNFIFIAGFLASIVVLTVCLVFYRKIDIFLLFLSAVSGIIFGLEKNLSGVFLGREQMHYEFASQVAAFIIVAVPSFFFIRALDLVGVYYLRLLASFLCLGMRGYFLRIFRYLERSDFSLRLRGRRHYNWSEIGFFTASGVAIFVQYHLDLLVLSFLISSQLQGAYFLALRIFLSFCLVAEILSFALTPYISRFYRSQEAGEFRSFYRRMLYIQVGLGIIGSVVFILMRQPLVQFFYRKGQPPVHSAEFLLYFSIFMFFRFVSFYTGNILSSTQSQHTRFYILVGSSVAMIVLEVVFGILFSVYGIIAVRAAVEIFTFVAYLVAVARMKEPTMS